MLIIRAIHIENDNVNLDKGAQETALNMVDLPTSILHRYATLQEYKMTKDNILEIRIDERGRLCIKPKIEKFTFVYRFAAEVHWDNDGKFLFSPKPREWSYLDWYKHIVSLIETEYHSHLQITSDTDWVSIPVELKMEILNFDGKDVA